MMTLAYVVGVPLFVIGVLAACAGTGYYVRARDWKLSGLRATFELINDTFFGMCVLIVLSVFGLVGAAIISALIRWRSGL